MPIGNSIFGMVGALSAFPRRLAAREVERHRGVLRRGITRKTTHVVFGRALLDRAEPSRVEAQYDAALAVGQTILSENAFLRLLDLAQPPQVADIPATALLAQSQLLPRDLALLSLFDAFEHAGEPYSFRDVILAKKYAGLIAGGATWQSIARSIHRTSPVTSLTAMSLRVEGTGTIHAQHGERAVELDGQHRLALDTPDDTAIEEFFEAAETAEAEKRYADAALLYGRCLALDPGDAVAAYNRANCLRELGEIDEAAHGYAHALKLDPKFIEAWFNYAGVLKDRDQLAAARTHLAKAVALDPNYADAVYNMAALEYEVGDLAEARDWWSRYLGLDTKSDWARLATHGIRYADAKLGKRKNAG
jgi:tetratricopeptide (TPR) repeat protein